MKEIQGPRVRGRGRPRSEESQRAILDATRALLEERGLADLTIEDVAQRAGVGKTTIYRRWPSKGTLAFEAFATEFLSRQPLPDTGSLRGDFYAALMSWIRAVKGTSTGRTLVGLIAEVQRDPELAEIWKEKFVTPVRTQHHLMVERAVARGEVDETVDPEIVVDLLFAPVYHRLLQTHLALNARFAQNLVDMILGGVASGATER